MRSYKIESYVPEETFLSGKDARFCRTAFEDCFVIDIHNVPTVIASCRNKEAIAISMADTASLLDPFVANDEPLMLPCSKGTLLIYPAWRHLELALAFLLREEIEAVEKAYKNAQRYAFSMIFDTEENKENDPQASLKTKLCVLQFYMRNLFGKEKQTNVSAHILMLANLVGCRLRKMSVLRANLMLDERELEKLGAYLCCTFMTMHRYNGSVSALDESDEKPLILTHVEQEYGIRVEQSVYQKIAKPTAFDLPSRTDFASFANHPAFKDYKIEESDKIFRLHLPVKQRVLLSALPLRGAQEELTLTLFPI